MRAPFYEDELTELYLGDSIEVVRELLDELGGRRPFNALLTDPPYSSGARRDAEKTARGGMMTRSDAFAGAWFSHDQMTAFGFGWFFRALMIDVGKLLSDGAHAYVFSDWRQDPNVRAVLESTGLRVNNVLTWDKEHFGMGQSWRNQDEKIVFASVGVAAEVPTEKRRGTVLRCRAVSHQTREHPTEKPVPLLLDVLRVAPGDAVLDPFCGVGGTLVAAKQLGRRAVGIDLDPHYLEKAARRLATMRVAA